MSDDRPRGPRRPPRPTGSGATGSGAARSTGPKPAAPKSKTTSKQTPEPKPTSKATPKPTPKPTSKPKPKATSTGAPKPAAKATATGKAGSTSKGTSARTSAAKGPPRRRPTPTAPGPRPQPTTRKRTPPPKASRSSIRFRDLPAGEVEAARSKPKATRTPTPGEIVADANPKVRRDWTGRVRAVRPDPATILPPPTPATAFRQRYGVVYDTHGPKMRLGLLWCVVVILSLAYEPTRPYGLAMVYGIVAGIAAAQVVDAWQPDRGGLERWIAALGGATLPVLATSGTGLLGAGLIVLVLVAAVAPFIGPRPDDAPPVFASAGLTVMAAGICGCAAAALVLLANYEIGAVIILLIFLMVYDASDFIVGSGASNGVEGPLAGALFIFATAMLLAIIKVPPFRGVDVWNFAMLAAVACPAGQLVASAMLPRANAKAPALRRIDSMLVAAPAWAGLIGLYLQSSGH